MKDQFQFAIANCRDLNNFSFSAECCFADGNFEASNVIYDSARRYERKTSSQGARTSVHWWKAWNNLRLVGQRNRRNRKTLAMTAIRLAYSHTPQHYSRPPILDSIVPINFPIQEMLCVLSLSVNPREPVASCCVSRKELWNLNKFHDNKLFFSPINEHNTRRR